MVPLTVTVVLPVKEPTVAVTTIAVPLVALPTDSAVVAVPVASVVAVVGVSEPAVAEKVTVAPFTGLFDASVTDAVMVTVAEPVEAMVELLDETVTAAAVPVPVVVPVPTNALSSLPPHPVNPIATASRTNVETNFRM